MRPLIVAHLAAAGFGWLTWLVPTDGGVYGILFVVIVLLFLKRCADARLPAERSLAAAVAAALGAMIGTRLFYLLTTGAILHTTPLQWLDGSRGTASWGAYLGGLLGMIGYLRATRTPPWPLIDVGASCAGISEVIGRWACFMAGDDFGRITSVPWGIRFPHGSFAFKAHVARGLLDPAASMSLAVHPLQFYLMANAAVVFTLTTVAWHRWRLRPGRTLTVFLILQGSTRFWWEFLRDPAAGGANGGLSTSQWTCLALVAIGVMLWATRGARPPATSRPVPR